MRLHNLAVDMKVPLMEQFEQEDKNDIFAPMFHNNITAAALKERIIQRL